MFSSFVRFIFVGVGAVLAHYFVALMLNKILGMNFQISNALGFMSGFLLSYLGHAKITYEKAINATNFFHYSILGLMNFGMSSFGVHVLENYFKFEYLMLIVVVTLPIINFFIGRLIFGVKG